MSVNIKDIARELNVSVSTVSRAINNQGRVSPKTRAAVLKTIERLNYRPNESARALREKRTKTLGILVPDIGNEFFAMVIKGAEAAAWREGYSLLVMSSNEEIERERQTLRLLFDKRVAGIVLASVDSECPLFEDSRQLGIPVTFIDNLPSINASFDYVTVDNRVQAYRLVRHLIELGHRRIALLNGRLSETTAEQRQRGYNQALAESGLEPIVLSGGFNRAFGRSAMIRLFDDESPPSAIFAANNHLAFGAIDIIRERGFSIPRDISVACFDAPDSTGLIIPKLCTVNQPAERIGGVAIDILLRKLSRNGEGVYERLILDPEIEWGDSVSSPRAVMV